ncbi:anthranilate synthase [Heyndrickxia shackletonii]|uniref:Anthranilate synthase n=1 Tax=Heyndrickxia shackletonii TaxID=157838 RepID=A0A0Q3WYM7_9BACI|nr:aminodeoxychorismate/anthranilate synthase component II [Heyndrickxia shackletonii]KQL54347.1 anthranilate synthase [Heyndrickxia shackletonii]MBB2480207.1 aminodeoxychorismate/anthranilate synthase component II [Bacillus sp. APMAM]NEZ01429.1 aminodeoxychorismate/anthranilate synthase component II [Heyndrickxia shackletonii]RTZ56411.1 aminodeoxychorismate/anthranilate synthase component II [Bacillus sp. SAJ1]
MILIIDNYDSFTYNLVQYVKQLGQEVKIFRNDKITIADIEKLQPNFLLLSPGPGNPSDSGVCLEIIHHFKGVIPILGVCLGHQAIAQAFGGLIKKAKEPVHGKQSLVYHDGKSIFLHITNPYKVTRYHSLVVDESTLPDCLEISAKSEDGVIMGIRHKDYKIEGVQFHPESIMTEHGLELLENFFKKQPIAKGEYV